MNSLIIFAVFVTAYIFQMFLGWQQLKDFNKTHTMLRRLGRVGLAGSPEESNPVRLSCSRLMKTVGFLKLAKCKESQS